MLSACINGTRSSGNSVQENETRSLTLDLRVRQLTVILLLNNGLCLLACHSVLSRLFSHTFINSLKGSGSYTPCRRKK